MIESHLRILFLALGFSAAEGIATAVGSDLMADSGQAATSGPILEEQAFLKGHNTVIGDFFGNSVSASGDTVVVGAASKGWDEGAVYVFMRNGTSWTQQAYLEASNKWFHARFGTSVSLSGDTLVVGAPLEDSNSTGVDGVQSNHQAPGSGAAYVFVRNGTTWSQQAYLKAFNTNRDDRFGKSVALSGDTLVVGAPGETNDAIDANADQDSKGSRGAGAAYVFVRNGTSWSQQAYLKASNTDRKDFFGASVSVSGDTVVVGAPGEDSNATGIDGDQNDNSAEHAGAAYVFVRAGTSWSQQVYLKASITKANDLFGQSVSVSDNTVVVGAPSLHNFQTVYVFERSGTTWTQQGYSQPGGDSVSISGDTLVVGSCHSNGEAGETYLLAREDSTWIRTDTVRHDHHYPPERLGCSVSVSADTVVIGAKGAGPGPGWCPPCNTAGAAYAVKISR